MFALLHVFDKVCGMRSIVLEMSASAVWDKWYLCSQVLAVNGY